MPFKFISPEEAVTVHFCLADVHVSQSVGLHGVNDLDDPPEKRTPGHNPRPPGLGRIRQNPHKQLSVKYRNLRTAETHFSEIQTSVYYSLKIGWKTSDKNSFFFI